MDEILNADKVKEFMEAMGAVVEITSAVYKMYLDEGLTREDSLYLTRMILDKIMGMGCKG